MFRVSGSLVSVWELEFTVLFGLVLVVKDLVSEGLFFSEEIFAFHCWMQ